MSRKLIVITGGSGYIGSILTPLIVEAGYKVRVLDRFFFGDTITPSSYIEKIKVDSRNIERSHLEGAFGVLDLAALSNDPTGEMDRIKTLDINYRARRRLQELVAELEIERYVLASSCSVYGFQEGVMDETSQTKPLTVYAEANVKAENSAMEINKSGASTAIIVFRQATMYGLSPRMRFDIAINGMTLGLMENGSIPILRDGSQWRPMIHVRDTSKAFIAALSAEKEKVSGEIFNVGSNEQNFQISQVASLVAQGINRSLNLTWYGDPDNRSYKVNFDKVRRVLDFTCDWTPEKGAKEIADALESGEIKPDIKTRTLAWYTEIIEWEKKIRELSLDGRIL